MYCVVEGCENVKIAARGMCWKHYARRRRHGHVSDPVYINSGNTCGHEGCEEEAETKGFCRKHYQRLIRHGGTGVRMNVSNGRCWVVGCDEKGRSKNLCNKHYSNFIYHRRKGNTKSVEVYLRKKNEAEGRTQND